jgi:hypothetical protein
MNFNDVVVLVEKPSARIVLFANWPIIADDGSEVCHCFSPLPSLRNPLDRGSVAIHYANNAVLAQNAVGDVF